MSGIMIPRTVQIAKEVAATFSAPQLKALGNVIYNGYATTGANTANKKGWQYKETAAAQVLLHAYDAVGLEHAAAALQQPLVNEGKGGAQQGVLACTPAGRRPCRRQRGDL